MNVLILTMGSDTGGVSIAIAKAFRGVPGWSVRSLVSMTNYIEYDHDLEWDNPTIEAEWNKADVIHLHHGFVAAERLHGGWKGWRLPTKPYVVEYHGTGFREDPEPDLAQVRRHRAPALVSTLDLYLLAPDLVEWAPPPVNVEWLNTMRQPRDDGRVIVAHAPTNRAIKSTDLLIEAVERLQDEGHPVELDLIEHRPWRECLERKARADIYFDQVILGFGCNALEAWGMGIPVIAGVDPARARAIGHEIPDNVLAHMEQRFGSLPFYHATEATIYDALKELVESPELREDMGQRGHQYVRRFHDEPVVVKQLQGIYERAVECFAPASIAADSPSAPAA